MDIINCTINCDYNTGLPSKSHGEIIMGKNNMDWKIWGKKVGLTILAVLIAGGASVWADNSLWLVLLPLLVAVQNYWKHK